MKNQEKYAYFYNRENKTESVGGIMSAHNWGPTENDAEIATRKHLPKCVEEYRILNVGRQAPFGTLMTDMLSINFAEIMDFFRDRTSGWEKVITEDDWGSLPEDVYLLTAWGQKKSRKDTLEDVNRLYMIRKYVEMCIECPKLYSSGQFWRLLGTIYRDVWRPRTLGFFAPVDAPKTGLFLFSNGKFREVGYYEELHLGICDFSDLDARLERDLLGDNSEDYLPPPTMEVFEFSDFVEAIVLTLFHLIQEKIAIKKCANCNKFFVPLLRSDAIYCNRLAPQDSTKTCKEYGSKVLWYESVVSDDVARLARNIYSAKQMLVKRNPDKSEYAEMFDYFKAEKKKWEEQVKAGIKTREEYAEWLRKMKLCKTMAEWEES